MASRLILAGDIGGTKTDLAIFNVEEGQLKIVSENKFHSKDYENLESIVQDFLKNEHYQIAGACFGIAGPIKDGKCHTTNLPWIVDTLILSRELKLSHVYLINDLEANAHGIFCLEPHDFFTIHEGKLRQKGNKALLSAGTGLGEAGIYFDGHTHFPFACEGGHADFAPRDEREIALLNFLLKEIPHVSYERVLSGMGIHNIYRFLHQYNKKSLSKEAEQRLKEDDPAHAISMMALEKIDPIAEETLDLFISLYGAEAGNLALKYMALGGVYIGGGIAPKILDQMKHSRFSNSFTEKGRLKQVLETIPVKVILNDRAALLGAARYAALKCRFLKK